MPSTDTLSQERLRSIEQTAGEAATATTSAESPFLAARQSTDETLQRLKEKCEGVGANVESLSATLRPDGTTIRLEGSMSKAAAEELFGLTTTQQKQRQAEMLQIWRKQVQGLLERFRQSALTDWMESILKLDQSNQSDAAFDELFDRIDLMLSSAGYAKIDAILAAMPVEGPSLTLMMGLLSMTRPAAQHLPSRQRFFDRVYRLCNAMRRDAETLLGGLR